MPLDEERHGRLNRRDIPRELRPHILYEGLRESVKWLWSIGGASVMAAAFWLFGKIRSQLDYLGIVLVFLLGLAVMYLAFRLSGRRSSTVLSIPVPDQNIDAALPALVEARDLRGERYRSLAPSSTFQVLQAGPQDPEPMNPEINWKRKFLVILRCRATSQTEVHAPDWICSNGYIPFQSHPSFWSILRAENVAAGGWMSDKWQSETQALIVAPNAVFQASVGLDRAFSIEEFKSRSGTQRVGMLTLPVTIDGREMEWRARF